MVPRTVPLFTYVSVERVVILRAIMLNCTALP